MRDGARRTVSEPVMRNDGGHTSEDEQDVEARLVGERREGVVG